MRKIQFVAVLTFALLILAVWQIWPPLDIKDAEGNVTKKGAIKLGLDLQGGMLLKLAVDDTNLPENIKLEEAVSRALEILRNRIDALGVAEPLIQREGDKYIVIQLPGIKDTNRALDIIGKTALLEFKLVSERYKITEMTDADGNVDPSKVPAEVMVLEGKEGERYVIEKKDLITGADLVDAKVQMGQYGEPVVGFKLSPAGGRKFAEITGDNVNRNLAIVLDDKVYSAPVIKSRISGGEGVIEGNFTIDTSKDLALILRARSFEVSIVKLPSI
ncbi:MAG TPA: hypothetical protein PK247_08970, partial [Candidatus Goldiibacteriota bacterium]|nr:hypothetical protein [Candidatus Goldiibacteriota bacterium]